MPAPDANPNAPVIIDALSMARVGGRCEYSFRQRRFSRLANLLLSDQPGLDVQLKFDLLGGKPVVIGQVQGSVTLTCQRCMQPMDVAIDETISLTIGLEAPVPGDTNLELEHEIGEMEEWNADPTRLDVIELVEEQVLLALPLVPKHADEHGCSAGKSASAKALRKQVTLATDDDKSGMDTQRPFANLRELLNR